MNRYILTIRYEDGSVQVLYFDETFQRYQREKNGNKFTSFDVISDLVRDITKGVYKSFEFNEIK